MSGLGPTVSRASGDNLDEVEEGVEGPAGLAGKASRRGRRLKGVWLAGRRVGGPVGGRAGKAG